MLYISVVLLSITWPSGPNWPFGGFCWALLRKYFCNCYRPFDVMGPLIIDMQEFTWVGWVGGLYSCKVKCHLCTSKVCILNAWLEGIWRRISKFVKFLESVFKKFQIFKIFIENLIKISNIFCKVVSNFF